MKRALFLALCEEVVDSGLEAAIGCGPGQEINVFCGGLRFSAIPINETSTSVTVLLPPTVVASQASSWKYVGTEVASSAADVVKIIRQYSVTVVKVE